MSITASGVNDAWRRRVGGLPRPSWYLWSGTLANRVGGFVEPFLVLYLAHRGLSTATVGAVTALAGAGGVGSQVVGGILADRFGRRLTVGISVVGSAVALAVLAVAPTVWALAVAATISGFFLDLYRPATAALVANIVDPVDRPRAYALQFWAVNLGFAGAAAGAGLLISAGYGLLFAIDGLTCLLAGALILRGTRGLAVPVRQAADRGGLGSALHDRTLLAYCGAILVGTLIYGQLFTTIPLAMREDGFSPAVYGAVAGVNGVLIVVLQPIVIPALLRRRRAPVLAAGHAIVGLGFGITALVGGVSGYVLPVAALTVGEIILSAVFTPVIADLAPPGMRARYQGFFGLSVGAGVALAPLVGAALLEGLGARALWTSCAAAGVALAVYDLGLQGRLDGRGAG